MRGTGHEAAAWCRCTFCASMARTRRVSESQGIRHGPGLAQRAFSRQVQIELGTLRDWELGARGSASTAKAYSRVNACAPNAVRPVPQTEYRDTVTVSC
jgi:DNA-binding transcriptional regulator YiaG